MFQDPGDPEILDQLKELRLWLDGFLTDRAEPIVSNNPDLEGEVWPYAITGDHNDALETTINWLEERKGDPKNDDKSR
jgi:hypothetical protein